MNRSADATKQSKAKGFVIPLALVLAVCVLTTPRVEAQIEFDDPGFVSEVVATFPPFTPVGLAFAPDGRIFVWQKAGVVRIVKDGVLLTTPFIDIRAQTNEYGARGLLGLALDPDFAATGFIYLLHTVEDSGNPNDAGSKTSRLIRVAADPANGHVALQDSAVVILRDIPSNDESHSIGTVRFGPDGTMFVGSGDAASFESIDPLALRAQDLQSMNGKILRINPDGSAPTDNPFYDGTDSVQSKVWAYGLRNPFRFSLDPVWGEPIVGDVGWKDWEEINEGRGANFGWPCFEGNASQPGYQAAFVECRRLVPDAVTRPLYTYNHGTADHFGVIGSTIVAGPVYTGTEYPVQYRGSLFIADYTAQWIKRIVFDADGHLASVVPFASNVDGPVAVEQGPDGLLYYVALNSGEVRRIRFNGPIAAVTATPTHGYLPLEVSFSSAGSRAPDGGSLLYSWTFGDGDSAASPNPSHIYSTDAVGRFTATLTVTDGAGRKSSDSVLITVGSVPPTIAISSPEDGARVLPGQTIVYQGSATDPDDGALPEAALSWTVLLHHNSHLHVVQTTAGSQGRFVIANHGEDGFAYELILTARDSGGLTSTASVILPVSAANESPCGQPCR